MKLQGFIPDAVLSSWSDVWSRFQLFIKARAFWTRAARLNKVCFSTRVKRYDAARSKNQRQRYHQIRVNLQLTDDADIIFMQIQTRAALVFCSARASRSYSALIWSLAYNTHHQITENTSSEDYRVVVSAVHCLWPVYLFMFSAKSAAIFINNMISIHHLQQCNIFLLHKKQQ